MNKFRLLSCLILTLGLAISACDRIEGEKIEPNAPIRGTQKVLLEEFTGQKCGACPNAHQQIETLLENYGDNLIPISIHAGHFAQTNATYPDDYTTPIGDEIHETFRNSINNYPVGFLNRVEFNGTPAVEYGAWSSRVFELLSQEPPLVMELATQFDQDSRILEIDLEMQYFKKGDAGHRLVVLITEDSLISPQLDYRLINDPNPPVDYIDLEYEQKHVLRTSITDGGQFGIPVKGNNIFVGERISHQFSYALPPELNARHCHVVAYVMNGPDMVVLQAEDASVIP